MFAGLMSQCRIPALCRGEPVADLQEHVDHVFAMRVVLREPAVDRATAEELHHHEDVDEIGNRCGCTADVEHPDDVGVMELSDRLGLVQEVFEVRGRRTDRVAS
jgi:hypothetical protein